jgi:hypothetical protein
MEDTALFSKLECSVHNSVNIDHIHPNGCTAPSLYNTCALVNPKHTMQNAERSTMVTSCPTDGRIGRAFIGYRWHLWGIQREGGVDRCDELGSAYLERL